MEKKTLLYGLAILIICGLGMTYAAMHWNFLDTHNGALKNSVDSQVAIANGMDKEGIDMQSRILVPNLIKMIFNITRRPFTAIFLPELFFSIFSLFAFFLLSYKLILDMRYSLLAVIALSLFTPYALQIPSRYGELLIIGFYSILIFFILIEKPAWYLFFLFLTSLQRPDIAIATVFFKVIYTCLIKKRFMQALFDLPFFLVPIVVLSYVSKVYGVNHTGYVNEYIFKVFSKIKWNMHFAKYLLLMYFPVIVVALLLFRYFDKIIKLILISLLPYLMMVILLGSFSESRLLFPIFSILIIGIIKVIKDKGIFEYVGK